MEFRSLGRSVSAALLLWILGAAALAQVPSAKHFVLVINENSSYSDVVANMPWLVAHGRANGYATNYQSDNGGSLLDYLWLASGSCESSANCTLPAGTHDFHCNGNDCYYPGTANSDPITDNNIFRELNNAGIPWKVYAQSYSAAGGTPTTPDNQNGTAYYRRHNGATWYSDILNNVDGSAKKIVDLSQLMVDLANNALPRFMIIVPDGNHDGHDCPVGMSNCTVAQKLAAVDTFLAGELDPILSTSDFQPGGSGLILVTFDECGGGTNEGCGASVYTSLIGPKVVPHTVSNTAFKHENALRTMLDSLGVHNYPGASAGATDMADFFSTDGKPQVVINSPAGLMLSSPVKVSASGYPGAGHKLTGWCVYVDSVLKYSAGAMPYIHPTLTMSAGAHTVVVRAWDSSGGFGDQTLTLTVKTTQPTVSVTTPGGSATVGSPVNVLALASPSAGQTIKVWTVLVDGKAVSSGGAVPSINTNLSMPAGQHTVTARAWDTSGSYGDKTLTLKVASQPAVAVTAPLGSSNVVSPVNIRATARPSSGHSLSGWAVYIDGANVYQAGAVSSINANVQAASGTHTVIVRVWDSSGAFGDRTLPVTVQPIAVNITAPLTSASVESPVALLAGAQSSHAITWWEIYVDSNPAYAQGGGNSVKANLPMSSGTHTVVVRAWDQTGSYGDQTIKLNVP